jgi:hypothetical protein
MARSADEIELAIERGRARVVTSVEAFQIALRDKLDWRRPVRAHPYVAVGVVFGVGLWLGVR